MPAVVIQKNLELLGASLQSILEGNVVENSLLCRRHASFLQRRTIFGCGSSGKHSYGVWDGTDHRRDYINYTFHSLHQEIILIILMKIWDLLAKNLLISS
jgi:hypothetical protein